MNLSSAPIDGAPRPFLKTAATHFWFKALGTLAFTGVFFLAYIHLLRHPANPVVVMPELALDRLIGFEPLALPCYATLWVYLSLPPLLMSTRREVVVFGGWMAALCLSALAIFYAWPSAVPPPRVDWAAYPAVAFLKQVDASGNACPSLHVATAVFCAASLQRQLGAYANGAATRGANALWCAIIVWSTLATKQHVALDVLAGLALGAAFAALSARRSAP